MTDTPYLTRLTADRVRSYLLVWGGAVGILCGSLLLRGAASGALIVAVLAAFGLIFRRTSMPGFVLIATSYFIVFPDGFPQQPPGNYVPSRTAFRLADLVLVAAVLCYLMAQFRLYSLTLQAVPEDRPAYTIRKGDEPLRRTDPILEGEVPRLFVRLVAVTILGQFIWLIVAGLQPTFDGFPGFATAASAGRRERLSPASARALMAGLVIAGALVVGRFAFWYWRLVRLRSDEARQLLLDTGWLEARREFARMETWRAWGKPGRHTNRINVKRTLMLVVVLGLLLVAVGFMAISVLMSLF